MSLESVAEPYQVVLDDYSVWQQGNMLAGSTGPYSNLEDWKHNLELAKANLASFTTASQVLRVSPTHRPVDLIDMDRAPRPFGIDRPIYTEGIITSDPSHIVFANPKDCGEIAVSAMMPNERPVIGLFHASRLEVDRKSYLRSLKYLCVSRGLSAEQLMVRLSPPARVESYAFKDITDKQKTAPRWRGYIEKQRKDGLWHIDFHRRMVDDLRDFGIKDDQMIVSPDYTAHPDSPYFSYSQRINGKLDGGNSLLFALR